jgi:isocitrate lyase
MYPDQSLYPVDSVPKRGEEDQPGPPARRPDRHSEGKQRRDWFAPIMADAEAGFGGRSTPTS